MSVQASPYQEPVLFKTLLLGLEVLDVELGILDAVLTFSVSGDLHLDGPIAFLMYLGRENRVRSCRPGEEVSEPGRKGKDGVSLLVVVVVDVGGWRKAHQCGAAVLQYTLRGAWRPIHWRSAEPSRLAGIGCC
jgi:hypothetical protein